METGIPRRFGPALWMETTENTSIVTLWRAFQSLAFTPIQQKRVHPDATQRNSRHVRHRYERSLL